MEKLIITLASTGNVPTKAINQNVPLTAMEIVKDIKTCVSLGVSIAHIHARDEDLKPTNERIYFKEIIERIDEEKIEVIKQVSTGARGGENSIAARGDMLDLNVHMASLATGSSNFSHSVNANAPDLIEALAKKMYDHGIKPEIEVFDTAMLYNAIYLLKKGVLKPELHFNFVMNVPGSMPGNKELLKFLIKERPVNSTFSVTAIGKSHVPLITEAIALGGHVRTGIEDCIYYSKDILATNENLVKRVLKIAKDFNRKIATVEEAKEMLGLY